MTMNNPQLSLLIKTMGAEALADAGDFTSIETAAHAKTTVVSNPQLVGGKDSLMALTLGGFDTSAIIAAMRADILGNEIMETLIASGVDWNDPLTITVLDTLVTVEGPITQAVKDTLTNLSLIKSSPAEDNGVDSDVTAVDFEVSWIAYKGGLTSDSELAIAANTRNSEMAAAQAIYDAANDAANAAYLPSVNKHTNISLDIGSFDGTPSEWQARVDALNASTDGTV
jgi:hypothetical protein